MPTAVVTPQIKAEIYSGLGSVAPYCFVWGGKYQTAFQTLQELCMLKIAEGISSGGAGKRTRTPRAKSTPTIVPEEMVPGRRGRGRPRGSKAAGRSRTTNMNPRNEAILKCIAAGYNTPQLIMQELQRAYGMTVRPNHLGIALTRFKKAGQVITDGTSWTMTQLGRAAAA